MTTNGNTTKRALFLFSTGIMCACGGMIAGGDDGSAADATGDVDGGGYTACTTPEGYQICGTQAALPQCPGNAAGCEICECDYLGVPPSGYCINVCGSTLTTLADAGYIKRGCDQWCNNDDICFAFAQGSYFCAPFSIGKLLGKYTPTAPNDTYRNLVRYGDLSAWTGEDVPSPTTCPSSTGYRLCGGTCGACNSGEVCAGRSPLHQWGVCVPDQAPPGQHQGKGDAGFNGPTICAPNAGQGVFVFTVDSASQGVAAQYGRCMPLAMCQALAATFPGGGTCMPQ